MAEAEHFTPILRWTVSDPTVAEIVESDQDFCTIRGIAHGAVTVTGDLYGREESFEIQVTDPAFAEFEDKFVDISGHWAGRRDLERYLSRLVPGHGRHPFRSQ